MVKALGLRSSPSQEKIAVVHVSVIEIPRSSIGQRPQLSVIFMHMSRNFSTHISPYKIQLTQRLVNYEPLYIHVVQLN